MVINHTEILDNRAAVVDIEGPLDSYTSPDFEDYVNQLLAKSIVFILFDAGRMEYVSSEGIGLLLFLQRKISEANGFFVIFNLSGEIMTLYRLLGFDKVFRIADSRADALQIMDRQMELRDRGITEEAEPEPARVAEKRPAAEKAAPSPAAPDVEPAPKPAEASAEAAAGGMVVECRTCKSLNRVHHDGDYICPYCNTEFSVIGRETAKSAAAPAADFGSLIVECKKCRSLIMVKKSGSYQCPDCGARFSVGADQTIAF